MDAPRSQKRKVEIDEHPPRLFLEVCAMHPGRGVPDSDVSLSLESNPVLAGQEALRSWPLGSADPRHLEERVSDGKDGESSGFRLRVDSSRCLTCAGTSPSRGSVSGSFSGRHSWLPMVHGVASRTLELQLFHVVPSFLFPKPPCIQQLPSPPLSRPWGLASPKRSI